jgi:peroxiredoxin
MISSTFDPYSAGVDSPPFAGGMNDPPAPVMPKPLDEIRRDVIEAFDPRQRALYLWMNDWFIKNDVAKAALKAGSLAPDFFLPDEAGHLVWSRELLARGPLVLSFFRGGWCPFCVSELTALDAAAPVFRSLGASLVAVTPETADLPRELKQREQLKLQILSDVDYGVGQDFGVMFSVPPYMKSEFLDAGLDLSARHGSTKCMLPVPATYVIDQSGMITAAFVDNDFTIRADPGLIIEELRRLGRSPAAIG